MPQSPAWYPGRRRVGLALALTCAAAALPVLGTTASAGPPPIGSGQGGVEAELVTSGLDQPMYVVQAPGHPELLYVAEREGTIEVLLDGVDLPGTFLDIQDQVSTDGAGGIQSLAFDPNFETNGLLYVYYTTNAGQRIQIDEYDTITPTDIDETSRREVIRIPHPEFDIHYGGTGVFGPDGNFYMALGDGGGPGDPYDKAQDRSELLGKMLRIDPHQSGDDPYTVPPGNPFVGKRGKDEIFALGLRNPFRFSFDSVTGRVAIGDVGQQKWEEIDYETRGDLRRANFGWDYYEGPDRYRGEDDTKRPGRNYEPPIFAYSQDRGNAVIGGLVVRDETLPTLYGRYLYADHSDGKLRSLIPRLGGARQDRKLGAIVDHPSSFVAGVDDTVYVTALRTGELYRLVPETP